MRRSQDRRRRLFRLLFVFAFVRVPIEGRELPPTTCHYEEDRVQKPCEIFHKTGCPVESAQNFLIEGWENIDNETSYHNITVRLSHTEGYFREKEIDECWKFKVSNRPYPEESISMDVDFLNGTLKSNILLFTGERECDYLYNSNYTIQQYVRDRERIAFTLQNTSGIRKVDLTLMGGECEVNCNGSINNCNVSTEDRSMENFSEPQFFTNLTARYYCIRVQHGKNCVIHTTTIKKEDPPQLPTPNPQEQSIHSVLLCSIFPVAAIILMVIFLKKRCSYGTTKRQLVETEETDPPTQWKYIYQQWLSSPSSHTVLLLYSRDSAQFCKVVEALRHLLRSFGNIKVLDPMEQSQVEEVSQNISGWVTQHLYNPEVKVVIVLSEGAVVMQNALINKQIIQLRDPHFLDPVFTHALRQMHENTQLGSDYRRIFPVRFEDFTQSEVSLPLIVSLKCYVLLKHLGRLIVELRNFDTQSQPDLEDIRSSCPQEISQLESAITNMKSYCANNPYYVENNFSLVVPYT
ncbi:uncharacterized protein LOC110833459 [Zootermopsis nevadensis]|uniref:uncharacterized protein LOC110833459 n=1 Tax=Zootermopsis nevadensis TaxID=136037 RepID=UPI000B8E345B|nr:uncharacterized protein LOC110833459 [Zootermopsis nevadensis]